MVKEQNSRELFFSESSIFTYKYVPQHTPRLNIILLVNKQTNKNAGMINSRNNQGSTGRIDLLDVYHKPHS